MRSANTIRVGRSVAADRFDDVVRSIPPGRPAATIVIPTWNAWKHTQRCLTSLPEALGPNDRVVVVDNGSSDETLAQLAECHWLDVVANEENQGFARACNQGAARSRGDVLVFLNNDTVGAEGWLDELLAPFAESDVGAVGPRSDNVSGQQSTTAVRYSVDEPGVFAESARAWREEHHNRTTEARWLIGFCLAVRRDAFDSIGGFDEQYDIGGYEDDDLCNRLRGLGLRLLIAHGSFVHHHGHATFDANGLAWQQVQAENKRLFVERWGVQSMRRAPLVTACLVVKDEEAMLAASLDSIRELAGEVVIYDTGSSDATVEIARAAGAQVVEGHWEDSFARARNAALEYATGEWVLSIDADERLQADPEAVRGQLLDPGSDVEAYLIAIENLHGAGNPRSVHSAIRLFRRSACAWRYRLHEQVVAADDARRPLRIARLSSTRLIHHGYESDVFDNRHKSERNLRLARAALDDEQGHPYALMNYGRALESAGRSEEAVECLACAAEASDDPITRRLAVSNLAYILGRMGRYEEALEQVDRLRRLSSSQVAADLAEGRTRLAMGQAVEGLAMLSRIPAHGVDDDGMEYGPHMVAAIRGEALASLGRFDEAADVVLDAIRSDGVLEADFGELLQWLLRAGRSPADITAALSAQDLVPMLGRVLRQPPALSDILLEGSWARFPDRLEPLAAAARIAPDLPVARALVWSARLRAKGLAHACPLRAIAARPDLEPATRIRAAAAAFGAFGEHGVLHDAREALDVLAPAGRAESLAEIGRLAPGMLDALSGSTPSCGPVPARQGGTEPAAAVGGLLRD